MVTRMCNFQCCSVTYCPLVLAWASTIHKAQGMEAGQLPNDYINVLCIDCGDLSTEHKNPGMCYVSASRARTLGDDEQDHPIDSSLYWFGSGMSSSRIRDIALRWDPNNKRRKIQCKSVVERENWVNYLQDRANLTLEERYNDTEQTNITNTTLQYALNTTLTMAQVNENVMRMIKYPNETWSELKQSSKYTVPRVFFK